MPRRPKSAVSLEPQITAKAIRKLKPEMVVSWVELHTLIVAHDHPGASAQELADMFHVSKQTIHNRVFNLRLAGLVLTKWHHPEEGCGMAKKGVYPTSWGYKYLHELEEKLNQN